MLYSAVAEVAQKRVPCPQRKKSERRALPTQRLRIKAVHHLVRSAVAAHRDKVPHTASVGLARNLSRLSCSPSRGHLHFKAASLQAIERRTEQFAAAPSASRRIHDREISLPQVSRTRFTAVNASRLSQYRLESHNGSLVHRFTNLFRQYLPLDLHRCGPRKIFLPHQISAHTLEIRQAAVARRDFLQQFAVEALVLLQPQNQDQAFASQFFFRPDVVRGKHAVLLHRKSIENSFNILGINVLTALGDDHVLLAPEELKMSSTVKSPQIAGDQPAVNDGLKREFRVVQIMRHDCLAANRDFAHALVVWIQNPQLDSGERLAHRICPKWLQIVERQRRPRLRQAVPIHHRDAEVIKELHRRRLHKCATGDQRQQLAAKRTMHTGQQHTAQLHPGPPSREKFVGANHCVQEGALPRRQFVELGAQAALQILYQHRHESDIGNPILYKRIAHELRSQRAQMHNARSAYERSDESHHKVDRVIGRKDA